MGDERQCSNADDSLKTLQERKYGSRWLSTADAELLSPSSRLFGSHCHYDLRSPRPQRLLVILVCDKRDFFSGTCNDGSTVQLRIQRLEVYHRLFVCSMSVGEWSS